MSKRSAFWNRIGGVAMFAVGLASQVAMAADASIKVTDAWTRPTLGVNTVTASYGTIANTSSEPRTIISASTDVAKVVELHMHINDNGVMRMRKLEGGIEVPANGEVVLKPGGLHIMLIDVTRKIANGETIKLQLTFANGETIDVSTPVSMKGPDGSATATGSAHGAAKVKGSAHN